MVTAIGMEQNQSYREMFMNYQKWQLGLSPVGVCVILPDCPTQG